MSGKAKGSISPATTTNTATHEAIQTLSIRNKVKVSGQSGVSTTIYLMQTPRYSLYIHLYVKNKRKGVQEKHDRRRPEYNTK